MQKRRITKSNFPGGLVDERIIRRGDACDQEVIQDILGMFDEIDETQNILQNKDAISTHWLGSARLYHTYYRFDGTKPYEYAGLCEYGSANNLHPRTAKRIFIISPYHAEDSETQERNIRFAKTIAWQIYQAGDLPVAPHLYFPRFIPDEGFHREWGIEAGHMMMDLCDGAVVATIDHEITEGMQSDIEYATINLGLEPEILNYAKEDATKLMQSEK